MKSSLLLSAAALVAMVGCTAVPKGATVSNVNTRYSEEALKPFVENGQLPGAIAILYKEGKQEVACVGYADVAKRRPITTHDMFMQCSQTKGFCGVTVAKLIEEGKIKLDDPVSKYLPEFQNVWYIDSDDKNWTRVIKKAPVDITIRMVMNHTAGFDFELPGKQGQVKGGGWSGGMPLRIVAAEAAGRPVNFVPGTKAAYSNTGIDVGAAVVEAVTGMKWEDYLKQTVLDPLGMKDTCFKPTEEQLSRQIEMYECVKDGPAKYRVQNDWEQRPYNGDHVFASAGAGIWTTVDDQLKFYKMLMNLGMGENGVRILKEETVRDILATNSRKPGQGGYSLGLWVSEKDDGWFGHGGAWGTNCNVNWKTKELKFWVVQLNGGPRPWDAEWNKAAEKFFAQKLDGSDADAYVGRTK